MIVDTGKTMGTENLKKINRKFTPTRITRLHFLKLFLRSLIFIAAITLYLTDKSLLLDNIYHPGANHGIYFLIFIWIFFVVEMLLRFFPSDYESMGCQKQFSRNFVPNENFPTVTDSIKKKHLKSVIIVGAVWIAFNAAIGALFLASIIDAAVLFIVALFFAVCDIICILFYCPFQSLMMKNRCCVTCRIYNWDFIMMFTPLVFIASYYALSLFAIALLLFIKWEITYFRHPEWFCEETNLHLSCAVCTEKLCLHKKSIRPIKQQAGNKQNPGSTAAPRER
jgi:hypothetical protein